MNQELKCSVCGKLITEKEDFVFKDGIVRCRECWEKDLQAFF